MYNQHFHDLGEAQEKAKRLMKKNPLTRAEKLAYKYYYVAEWFNANFIIIDDPLPVKDMADILDQYRNAGFTEVVVDEGLAGSYNYGRFGCISKGQQEVMMQETRLYHGEVFTRRGLRIKL